MQTAQSPGEAKLTSEHQAGEDSKQTLAPGVPRRVGNYEIIEKIGEGGMGAVYKARHVELESYAAVKFLPANLAQNETFVKRFEREAKLAAQLTSSHSIRTFDVGIADGMRFILMEYVEGESLSQLLEREGKLEEKEALSIVHDIAAALEEAHEHGIVHRDIKPENILLTRRRAPKLADLGIAKNLESEDRDLTLTGFAIGTPSYMSPEQARGVLDVDTRSDIYSLGATLYRMVVGDLPFKGDTPLSIMHQIASDAVPDPLTKAPGVSRDVGAVICKMMAKAREQRYQTVGEVMSHLESLRAHEGTGLDYDQATTLLRAGVGAPSGVAGSVPSSGKKTARVALLAGVPVALVLIVAGYFIFRGGGEKPQAPPTGETDVPVVAKGDVAGVASQPSASSGTTVKQEAGATAAAKTDAERKKAAAAKAETERKEAEAAAAAKVEAERKKAAAAKAETERKDAETTAAARADTERKKAAAAKAETERKDAEAAAAARADAERKKAEAAKAEAAAAKAEAERKKSEAAAAARADAERKKAAAAKAEAERKKSEAAAAAKADADRKKAAAAKAEAERKKAAAARLAALEDDMSDRGKTVAVARKAESDLDAELDALRGRRGGSAGPAKPAQHMVAALAAAKDGHWDKAARACERALDADSPQPLARRFKVMTDLGMETDRAREAARRAGGKTRAALRDFALAETKYEEAQKMLRNLDPATVKLPDLKPVIIRLTEARDLFRKSSGSY